MILDKLKKIRGLLTAVDCNVSKLYVVGGYVRDTLAGLPAKDIDIAVFQDETCLKAVFGIATRLSAECSELGIRTEVYVAYPSVTDDFDDFSKTWLLCMKVHLEDTWVDLLFSRTATLEDCIATFDFNMNQVSMDEDGAVQQLWDTDPCEELVAVVPVCNERTERMFKKWSAIYRS